MESIKPATFIAYMGMAQIEITPPAGINSRVWGAATHEVADGVHMPLLATALVIRPDDGVARVIVSIDSSWIGEANDWWDFRMAIAEAAGITGKIDNVLLCLSHTHAAPPLDRSRQHLPGGDLIIPYITMLREALMKVTQKAADEAVLAHLTVESGTCTLARNRDLPLDDEGHFACGYNPHVAADDTLLVGRITEDRTGTIVGTIVNYACHPTTLAWENTQISPDFVGTMRTTVAQHTANAPCLFLQGASGELSAQDAHQGELAVAERQGRQLGFAVLSTIEGMIPAGKQLVFGGIKESGAKLAYWRAQDLEVTPRMRDIMTYSQSLAMPIKPDWPSLREFERLHAETDDRVLKERYFRRIGSRRRVGDGTHSETPFTFWRLGDFVIITTPTEMYSQFQTALRAAYPDTPVMVANLVNGSMGYVVPSDAFQGDLYQADLTPFASESMVTSINFAKQEIGRLTNQ